MSRLYYPPGAKAAQHAATLAAASGVRTATSDAAMATMAPPPASSASEFTEKIVKMVPSELVTAYTAAVGVISDVAGEDTRLAAYGVTFLVCFLAVPLYLYNEAEPGMPKWTHIIISTLAFPLWAYLVSGNMIMPEYYNGSLALLGTILFSVITGAIPVKK